VAGREKLTWRNRSSVAVKSVYLHLYMNAFEGTGSTFFTEKRQRDGAFRSGLDIKEGEWGHIALRSVTQGDVKVPWTFVHPDNGPALDHTVVRFDLPSAVAPGASTTFDIDFHTQLPRVMARTGYFGTFHLVGQWYPKIAVLELPGERGATAPRWNAHEMHLNSEFYADFGSFDVRLTVPKEYTVGATGEPQGAPAEKNGMLTHRYVQGDVHDFAWTADKRSAKPMVETWTGPGSPNVTVTVLYPPEYAASAAPAMKAAKDSLTYFSNTLGPYPYKTLTVVIPPHNAEEAGGMEYPTFFTAEGYAQVEPGTATQYAGLRHHPRIRPRLLLRPAGEQRVRRAGAGRRPERILGPAHAPRARPADPRRHALHAQDRHHAGFDAFAAERAGHAAQRPGRRAGPERLRPPAGHRPGLQPHRDPDARPGSARRQGADGARIQGILPALEVPPPEHRRPARDPGRSDRPARRGRIRVRPAGVRGDQGRRPHRRDQQPRTAAAAGHAPGGRQLGRGQAGDIDKRVEKDREAWKKANPKAKEGSGPYPFRTEVLVRRYGAAVPQTLVVKFADGSVETVRWDANESWHKFSWVRPARAVSAELDPQRLHYLDVSKLDDSRTLKANASASRRWGMDIAAFFEYLLTLIATV
jgi:hypothetical protein